MPADLRDSIQSALAFFAEKPLGAAATLLTLEDKLASQKQIKTVEAQRNDKRRSLFEAQDAIDQQREELIGTIEGKLTQKTNIQPLFSIRWKLH